MKQTVKIENHEYPVSAHLHTKEAGTIPLVDIPMMSDYKWHLLGLQSRLENPELYRDVLGEDVEAAIAMLQRELASYDSTEVSA